MRTLSRKHLYMGKINLVFSFTIFNPVFFLLSPVQSTDPHIL